MGETRPRPVPSPWSLRDRDGVAHSFAVRAPTLLVAVKTDCDGCRPFYGATSAALEGLDVVVVTRDDPAHRDFAGSARPVYGAPGLLDELEVRWPPFFVLVAPDPPRVVVEGVAFAPEQVVAEMASRFARDSATGQWRFTEENR